MRKILSLMFFGFLLSGCYTNSLTMVGPATGVVSGKVSETVLTTSLNHAVKLETGKSPLEHVLSEHQIKIVEKNKKKINPCSQNKKLCNVIKKRIENTRKQLLGLNLQARIEKQHKKIILKQKNQ